MEDCSDILRATPLLLATAITHGVQKLRCAATAMPDRYRQWHHVLRGWTQQRDERTDASAASKQYNRSLASGDAR